MGLMEVLVASAVLAGGLLCLLQWHAVARQLDVVSRQRVEASLLMMDLSERLAMLRELSVLPESLLPEDASTRCGTDQPCPVADFAHDDMVTWRQQVISRLPQARIQGERVALAAEGLWSLSITLSWSGGSHSQSFLW
jgi:hypothetical protein